MTPSSPLPPKLAPKGTPFTVALYLDHAAERLRPIAERSKLDFQPYDIQLPNDGTWGHHLYGKANERDYAIQVLVNDVGASTFKGHVVGFFLHHVGGQELWPQLVFREVLGMADMAAAVTETVQTLRLACVWSLPHPTAPDLKT